MLFRHQKEAFHKLAVALPPEVPLDATISTMDDRARSRSPIRRTDRERERPRRTGGGFRWKEKRRDEEIDHRGEERRLERGYRERGDRPRSPRRDRERDRHADRYRDNDRDRRRFDERDTRPRVAPPDSEGDRLVDLKEKKKEKKEKKPAAAPTSSEPMIVVHVNDRLGTKAAIPCLASDPIRECLPLG